MTWNIVVQSGHLINVTGVKFAPDGRSLATCSADESIRLWDIGLGCESGVLSGHRGPVYKITYSGDGRLLASGGWDQEVRIWEVDSRKTIQVLRGVAYHPVDALAFSGDGSTAAATGTGMSARPRQLLVWDTHSGSTLASLAFPGGSTSPLALSPSGAHLAFRDAEGRICILDVLSGEQRILRPASEGGIVAFAFTRDGSMLFVLSDVLRCLDSTSAEVISEEHISKGPRSLAVLADGRVAVHTAEETLICANGSQVVLGVADAISPNGDLLARIAGRQVELIDPESQTLTRRLGGRLRIETQPGNLLRQFVLAASPVEPLLAAAGPDGLLRLWDLARNPGPRINRAGDGWINALAFSPDGTMIAGGGSAGIQVWRRDGGSPLLRMPGKGTVEQLAFSGEGSALVVIAGNDVTAFDVSTGRVIESVSLEEPPKALAVSRYNQVAVATASKLLLWTSFLVGEPGSNAVDQIRDLNFALDGRLAMGIGFFKWGLLGQTLPGKGAVYSPGAGSLTLLEGHVAAVRAIAFSPDGLSVATGGEDGALMVWDASSGERRFAIERAHSGDVTSVAWTCDGRFAVTTGYDGAVRLWGSGDGAPVATLLSLDENDYVSFTADGRYAATKGGLSTIVLRTDDGLYPFEQFDLQLNRPDVLLESVGYAPSTVIDAYADAHRRRLVRLGVPDPDAVSTSALPKLRLTSDPGPVSESGSAVIDVELLPAGRPLRQLHASVNDVPVYGRAGMELDDPETALELRLELTPGENEVQLWTIDDGGAQSMRRSFRVFDARPEQPRRLLVVAVGVSAYDDERYRLQYAAKDAHDLVAELRKRGTRFAAVEPLLLQDATHDAILGARGFLEGSTTSDHVVLLLAGHGVLLGAEFAFLPADTAADDLAAKAIRYEDIEGLIDGIPARRRLVLLDTCHSGEDEGLGAAFDAAPLAGDVTRGRLSAPIDTQRETTTERREIPAEPMIGQAEAGPRISTLVSLRDTFADLRQESGAFVIAAAGSAEYALERADLRNGVFTASVLETLRSDERTTVTQLASEVSRRVLSLTGGRQQPMIRRENLADDYYVI